MIRRITIYQNISKIRRAYNSWVANETLEDYALRFAPRSFRKWSEFQVANTAFGSTSFLVLEAIGGFLSINYGFTNAVWAILTVGLVIFLTSFPITYYAARFNIDMDLLTRSAGFGYLGSTLTSLIYASFTFTLFALEASIMSLALELYFGMPLWVAHIVSALTVIPLVAYGITTISRLQLWTQPLWMVLLILPYTAVAIHEEESGPLLEAYFGIAFSGQGFNLLAFGSACTVAFSMIAQIGEQVDFLRFMPEKRRDNRWRWWLATLTAGPGWIFFGMLRQIGGALLAHLCIRHGISPAHAHEPTQMYMLAYQELIDDPKLALGITTLFVILSQIKINVTNAYAGSLAWSNFFSRLTHSHPGRVIWLVFNVSIALLLMELGVFGALEKVLGLFSHLSIAWIGAVAADLCINKAFKPGPAEIEFKRAYLPDLNPVGILSTAIASLLSVLAYMGAFGQNLEAFSAFIALGIAIILVPLINACIHPYPHLARERFRKNGQHKHHCSICENQFEHEDVAFCPAYNAKICSLCCSLDARCMDACKPGMRLDDYLTQLAKFILPDSIPLPLRLRLIRFNLTFLFLSILTTIFIGTIYFEDLLSVRADSAQFTLLLQNFLKVYSSLLVFIGLCSWWLILNDESRRVAHEETTKQTQLLLQEIEEHKFTDKRLQQALRLADNANSAKSRFLSNMSHEIRTPLNSILGYTHILAEDPSIPAHRRLAVDTLKRSGEHLAALIEDILDIARIEARKFEFKQGIIAFKPFIQHLQHIFQDQAEAKQLSFDCQFSSNLPNYVRGDEKRIGQILMNLLGNAVKFTDQGGIVFSISYSSGVTTFKISDSGPGIDPEQIPIIFQPFTRIADASTKQKSGSGLGLTISKILTELMGGELALESCPGKGSSFQVRLLLPSVQIENQLQLDENIYGYAGTVKTILVVDDQFEHRQLLQAVLQPLGFVVWEADCGETCLKNVETDAPDLILMDVSMAGMNGFETVLRLRHQGYKLPILIISANAYPSDRLAADNAGANDFLSKPISIPELLLKLKQHLGLTWLCRIKADSEETKFEAQLDFPDLSVISELQQFIRIGDILGLNKKIAEFEQGLHYPLFFSTLKKLSLEFRLSEIKKLLASAPRQSPPQ